MNTTATTVRPLYVIAQEIKKTWKPNVHPWAKPYVDALLTVDKMSDRYICEDARTQVIYLLGNMRMWRGEDAKRIKAELNSMLNAK